MKKFTKKSSYRVSINFQKYLGLSLPELIVMIASVGVLVATGYPSYINYMVKFNRSTAVNFVNDLVKKQNQNGLESLPYVDQLSLLSSDKIPYQVAKNYVITLVADNSLKPAAYSISASPIGDQLNRDMECGTLEINQSGIKTISGISPLDKCW